MHKSDAAIPLLAVVVILQERINHLVNQLILQIEHVDDKRTGEQAQHI